LLEDLASEYGFVGQLVQRSLATARCSEPVSRITLTNFEGVPTYKFARKRLS